MMKYLSYIDSEVGDLSNRIVVITGANSGIGFSATRYLAYKNATVIMACRNIEKAKNACKKILLDVPSAKLVVMHYDQASLFSIDAFAKELQTKYPHIDAFVLNAGVYHPQKGMKTEDGLPLTIGTNFVGVYYLIKTLKAYFLSCKGLRLIIVGSILHVAGHTKNGRDYLKQEHHSTVKQYCVSKHMLMSLESEIADEFQKQIIVTCMHPGVAATGIITEEHSAYPKFIANLGNRFLRTFANSPDKSSLGIVLLVGKDKIENGDYLVPRGIGHLTGYPKKVKQPNLKSEGEMLTKECEEALADILEKQKKAD